jgi:LAO/AO transport system kinase
MSKPRPDALLRSAIAGDRVALARTMTMIEQGGTEGAEINRAVGEMLAQHPNAQRRNTQRRGGPGDTAAVAHVVGITGAPGAGKSTFTDALLNVVIANDRAMHVAVLLVDPSSPVSGGAILGDRVRMADRALTDHVFLRSMATRGHAGGLSIAVSHAVRLLDVVGFGLVLIETVGVGQVELDVAKTADTTVVLLNPGWGDAVQASKAGLMEIADIFVINKADRAGAAETEHDVLAMLQIAHDMRDCESPNWQPLVRRTVATTLII